MAKSFAEDENNDIYIDNSGNLAIAEGIEAVLFVCKATVETMLGEMIYQTNQGMPNFQVIWAGNPNIPQYKAALVSQLQAVQYVKEVKDVIIEPLNGTLQYTATIVVDLKNGVVGSGQISNVGVTVNV